MIHVSIDYGDSCAPVKVADNGGVPVALDHHARVPQLLSHVLGAGARHLDPRLGEERARREDEHQVEHGVERVRQDLGQAAGQGTTIE